MNIFEKERIITPEISLGCNMTLGLPGIYQTTTAYSLVPSPSSSEDPLFWLGLLNSKLMWWFLSNTGTVLRGGYFRFKTNYLKPFPLRVINFSSDSDKANHDLMINLVKQMLDLHKRLAAARLAQERTLLQRQIAATDAQIDRLVYQLYALTDEEIAIVENNS